MFEVFLVILCSYVALAWFFREKIHSTSEFLTKAPVKLLPFSLVAMHLSVTGTLAAFLALSDSYGYLVFAAPAYALLTYAIFYVLVKRMRGLTRREFPIAYINELLSEKKPSRFNAYYMTSILIFQAFFLGWEVYIGSGILGPIVFPEVTVEAANWAIAGLLLLTVGLYSMISGYSSVVRTDLLQVFFALLVFVGVIVSHWGDFRPIPWEVVQAKVNNIDFILFIILATLANVAYRLQSPLDWQMAEVAGEDYGKVLKRGFIILLPLWIILCLMGIWHEGPSYPALFQVKNFWIQMCIVIGVAAFLMSTADSIVSGCLHGLRGTWQIYFKPNHDQASQKKRLFWFRFMVLPFLLGSSATMFFLMKVTPNFVQVILSFAGSFVVFAPVFAAVALGRVEWLKKAYGGNGKADMLFALFLISMGVQAVVFLNGWQSWSLAVVLGAGMLSTAIGFLPQKENEF